MSVHHGTAFGGMSGGGQRGSGMYQNVLNWMVPRGNRLKDGEVHPPVYTDEGWKISTYLGPGTKFLEKVKSGAKPVNEVDRVARAHDARYARARPGHELEDMRAADKRMVEALARIGREKKDYRINLAIGKYPIKAKMKAEDWKLAGKNTFTTPGSEKMSPADAKFVDDLIARETQLGYGKGKHKASKRSTGGNTWRQHVAAHRAKHPNMSYKACLKAASKTYARKR